LKALTSAVIATGDVAYSLEETNWPYGVNFGLAIGPRGEMADPARGWRGVLSGGQLIEPTTVRYVAA
jgi:hypothetical protein